jgi:hypothetical protein
MESKVFICMRFTVMKLFILSLNMRCLVMSSDCIVVYFVGLMVVCVYRYCTNFGFGILVLGGLVWLL